MTSWLSLGIPICTTAYNLYDGDPMKLVMDDMLANKLLQTWTNLEVYEMYLGLGGQLSRQQMLTNLTTHLGDDIVISILYYI